jgi:hypothetical protein
MGRLKAMVRSALDDRSPRFLLGTVALGVVVALLAGFAIGYKVDDTNGGSGGKSATQAKKSTKKAPKIKEAPLLIGGVYSLTSKKMVVLNAKAKPRPMGLGRKTRIFATSTGKDTDIKVGARVLFAPSPTSATTATEVVVLPETATFGQEVTAVVRGTSMSLKSLKGTDVIKTGDAVVLKTGPGNRRSIVKGGRVAVRYFVIRGKRNSVTDVVVLPKNTKFK